MSKDQPDYSIPALGPISKESRIEWHSQLSNHGTSIIWRNATVNVRHGKFFPRGCRGFIATIDVYIQNTTPFADNVRVNISPEPGIRETYTAVIAVPALQAPAWLSATFNIMWDRDSLFIFLYTDSGNAQWATDVELNFDAYRSGNYGDTWTSENWRLWIRVNFVGETAGDVPVSGTISVVEIPAVAACYESAWVNVPNGVQTPILTIVGAGTLIQAQLRFTTVVAPGIGVQYVMILYADGVYAFWYSNRDATQSMLAASGRSSCAEFYADNIVTVLTVRVGIKFKRTLELRAIQISGAPVNTYGALSVNEIR